MGYANLSPQQASMPSPFSHAAKLSSYPLPSGYVLLAMYYQKDVYRAAGGCGIAGL